MAVNLKVDLINELVKQKYFAELELGRLAGDPNMNYESKIDLMEVKLKQIALLNGEMALAQQYFPDPAPVVPVASDQIQTENPPVQTKTQPLPGQTHGEG
jgi:hypothetical protein